MSIQSDIPFVQMQTKTTQPVLHSTRSTIKMEKQSKPQVLYKNSSGNQTIKKKIKRKRLFTGSKRTVAYQRRRIPLSETFTLSEDRLILSSVIKLGPKFKVISSYFPMKSLSTVKNRYYKYLRYRWTQIMGKDFESLVKENQQMIKQDDEIVDTSELFPEVKDILKNMIRNIKSLVQS
ncbi:unnamed protein product [Paramecium pentaurelia]|uniref:Myb-like domain-containing protein n=1 Tax=Paramecium pentaurelia TaxID=43138 RepID=A0A8S1UWJ0_9CILI|nr:unnamed protein product [Paramecium pentaurelia]